MCDFTMLDRKVYDRFVKLGEVIEIRALDCYGYSDAWEGYAKGIVSGYFDDHNLFSRGFLRLIKEDSRSGNLQIYQTLQVIDESLIGRAFNKLIPAKATTNDKDVKAYRWLPIDLDPVRKSGISSSDDEIEKARLLSENIYTFLKRENWPAPIRAMSGNGYHLLYPLDDLPAQDKGVQDMIKKKLGDLSNMFSNEHVHLDTSLYNPARIIKLYGTMARKGNHVPAGANRVGRPHRKSYIYDLGE